MRLNPFPFFRPPPFPHTNPTPTPHFPLGFERRLLPHCTTTSERRLMVTSTVQQCDDVNGFFSHKIENTVGKRG